MAIRDAGSVSPRIAIVRRPSRRNRVRGAVALVVALLAVDTAAAPAPTPAADGEALYVSQCATCHGRGGRGDGPDAFLFTSKPRNLRDGFLDRYKTHDLVRRILDAESLPLPLDVDVLRARVDEIEALVAHLRSIPVGNWRLTTHGQRIFLDRCQSCHGSYGRPEGKGLADPDRPPADLSSNEFQRSVDDRQLLLAVRHGRPGMPAIPLLRDDDDARALVAYVRALSPGFELYERYCAVCHGTDGHPGHVVEPSRRPSVVFDREYFAHHDLDRLRVTVWHMLDEKKPMMPHFRGS